MKICLLGASFDTRNMGVSALAQSSVQCLLHRWPDAEVVLLGAGRCDGEHWLELPQGRVRLRTVPVRFCPNIFVPNHFAVLFFWALFLKCVPLASVRNWISRRNTYVRLMLETDLFADITGGDSFSDIYGMWRFVQGFCRKVLPLVYGKRLVLLPQTYGPYRRAASRLMARCVLRRAAAIYSRDRAGVDYARRLCGDGCADGRIQFVPDVAFIMDSRKPQGSDAGTLFGNRTPDTVIVGVNVSGLLYHGGYTRDNMFGLADNYPAVMYGVIDALAARPNTRVLLVPHVLVSEDSVESDLAACERLLAMSGDKYPGRIAVVRGDYDQAEIKYVIGLCDFFIGSRMHACIAALSQKIPAVGLAYSDKFAGVFDSVGVGDLVVDLRVRRREDVIHDIDGIYSRRGQIAARLAETIPGVKDRILQVTAVRGL